MIVKRELNKLEERKLVRRERLEFNRKKKLEKERMEENADLSQVKSTNMS